MNKCKYCKGIYGEDIIIKSSPYSKETQPDRLQIVNLKEDKPGAIIFRGNLAQGTFDINYCPMCGEELNIEYGSITDEEIDKWGKFTEYEKNIIKKEYSRNRKGTFPNPMCALY